MTKIFYAPMKLRKWSHFEISPGLPQHIASMFENTFRQFGSVGCLEVFESLEAMKKDYGDCEYLKIAHEVPDIKTPKQPTKKKKC